MSNSSLRLDGDRGRRVDITVDGMPCSAFEGETIAGALFAAGRAHSRHTPIRDAVRGYYCGMGVCWECALVVDGRPNVRACMTLVQTGMRIETQAGFGPPMAP
ncbi:MAG: (2Fe-2S)-binding protein [Rhodospirillales bacterium]|nr:(2Fe-2S)-binding protein [Rhodospirillales bacterium]